MFCFVKVVKLIGLFRRNPSDVMFLPVSIIFGYFHGLIKIYALCTLNMVRPTDGELIHRLRIDLMSFSSANTNSRPLGEAELTPMRTTTSV